MKGASFPLAASWGGKRRGASSIERCSSRCRRPDRIMRPMTIWGQRSATDDRSARVAIGDLYYEVIGQGPAPVKFAHGLGGNHLAGGSRSGTCGALHVRRSRPSRVRAVGCRPRRDPIRLTSRRSRGTDRSSEASRRTPCRVSPWAAGKHA